MLAFENKIVGIANSTSQPAKRILNATDELGCLCCGYEGYLKIIIIQTKVMTWVSQNTIGLQHSGVENTELHKLCAGVLFHGTAVLYHTHLGCVCIPISGGLT